MVFIAEQLKDIVKTSEAQESFNFFITNDFEEQLEIAKKTIKHVNHQSQLHAFDTVDNDNSVDHTTDLAGNIQQDIEQF